MPPKKKLAAIIKLQINAGVATPAPPVGPALGQHGVNIMGFCKEFNAATKDQAGMIIPVVITVYQDKSFTFITKSPPAAVLLKKAAGIASGSKTPNKEKVGKVTRKQILEIAKLKKKDINVNSDDAAVRLIAGTATLTVVAAISAAMLPIITVISTHQRWCGPKRCCSAGSECRPASGISLGPWRSGRRARRWPRACRARARRP